MNVKPGDLCYICGSPDQAVNGHVVTAVKRFMFRGEPHWEISPVLDGWWWAGPEKRLRPIRDPGDDAKDETLTWLPAPEKVYITTKENA